jgi:chemotaxis signal transduction protein
MTMGTGSPPAPAVFDWGAAFERLERLRRAVDPAGRLDADSHSDILRRRAEALARPPVVATEDEIVDLVGFRSGGQVYGLPLDQVDAVVQCPLLRIPGLTALHIGVFNHRGATVAAVDLSLLLGHGGTDCPERVSALVVHAERRRLGLVADELLGIVRQPAAGIRPLQVSAEVQAHGAIVGITGESWLVLDAVYLVRDARLLVDEEVGFMSQKGEDSA